MDDAKNYAQVKLHVEDDVKLKGKQEQPDSAIWQEDKFKYQQKKSFPKWKSWNFFNLSSETSQINSIVIQKPQRQYDQDQLCYHNWKCVFIQ